jgi:hypothetical protein
MKDRLKARLEYLRPLRRAGKLSGWAFREWLLLEKCAANEAEREPQQRQLANSGGARAWANCFVCQPAVHQPAPVGNLTGS